MIPLPPTPDRSQKILGASAFSSVKWKKYYLSLRIARVKWDNVGERAFGGGLSSSVGCKMSASLPSTLTQQSLPSLSWLVPLHSSATLQHWSSDHPSSCQTVNACVFLWNQTSKGQTGQRAQSYLVSSNLLLRKFYTVHAKSRGAVVHMNGIRNGPSINLNIDLHLEIQLFSFLLHLDGFVKCWVILKIRFSFNLLIEVCKRNWKKKKLQLKIMFFQICRIK